MQRTCFYTSIALNYLPRALALADSVFEIYPAARFVVSMVDLRHLSDRQRRALAELVGAFAARGRSLAFFDPLSLYERPDLLAFKLDIVELCTCVKPAVALHLLDEVEAVTYLDPDVILFAPLPDAVDGDAEWDVEVTPHALAPSTPRSLLSERLFLNYGVFNLGYLGLRRSAQTLAFLRWWADFCRDFCIAVPQVGLFADQKPVDLLPCFVDRVRVLRHPGCNVAWWNLFADGRRLVSPQRIAFGETEVPLVFFHFSNLHRPVDERQRKVAVTLRRSPDVLLSEQPLLRSLFEAYDRRVLAHEGAGRQVGGVPALRAGRRVPALVRVLLGEALRRGMAFERDPFSMGDARIAACCARFLLRHLRWADAKLFVSAQLRFARSSLSTHLLQFHR